MKVKQVHEEHPSKADQAARSKAGAENRARERLLTIAVDVIANEWSPAALCYRKHISFIGLEKRLEDVLGEKEDSKDEVLYMSKLFKT